MNLTSIKLENYPKSFLSSYHIPFRREVLTLELFDSYATSAKIHADIGRLGAVLGVYKKKIPSELRDVTHLRVEIRIRDAKIPPIEIKQVKIPTNPERKMEIHARLKLIYDIIQPYRDRAYDAIVKCLLWKTADSPIRQLSEMYIPMGTLVKYKGNTLKITCCSEAAFEMYTFVAQIHRRYALLALVRVAEKDTKEVPRRIFERHVLRIVKAFL